MTEKTHLRELGPEDEERIAHILSQEKVIQHTLFPLMDRDQTKTFLRSNLDEQVKETRKYITMAVTGDDSNTLIGLCGLVLNPAHEDAEVWYLLDPVYWNRGIATKAVARALQKGFAEYDAHRMWATCLPENPPSARVLEKAGFRKEGYLKEHLKIRGEWKDCCLYAILDHEWRKRNKIT